MQVTDTQLPGFTSTITGIIELSLNVKLSTAKCVLEPDTAQEENTSLSIQQKSKINQVGSVLPTVTVCIYNSVLPK